MLLKGQCLLRSVLGWLCHFTPKLHYIKNAPYSGVMQYTIKENRMNRLFISIIAVAFLSACSSSDDSSPLSSAKSSFPSLPSSSAERVTLDGVMSFWMYEGDAGCYGTITDGAVEVNLWVDADSCGEKEFGENEAASIEVTFNPENQYGPGKTYTITSFN